MDHTDLRALRRRSGNRIAFSLLLVAAIFLMPSASAAESMHTSPGAALGSLIAQDLARYSNAYWARVAGLDTGLPPRTNGHDEFAAQWIRDMRAVLHGIPAGMVRRPFTTPGFRDLPARRPGENIIMVVPGSVQPARSLLIGCHYDGEPTSQGSAYDDASGCMIALGVARVLGSVWRAHGMPAITVEFAMFDGEEQGLDGSSAYAFDLRHGAIMPVPALMINEEQNGVGYPVRPFGLIGRNPLPAFAVTSMRVPLNIAAQVESPRPVDPAAAGLLVRRLRAARDTAFAQLHSTYATVQYVGGGAPAFTGADKSLVAIGPGTICCSDNIPFQSLGVPTATFSGDYHYYERGAPGWSFPFDQPEDTFAALACDTGGSPSAGQALQAALELPARMTLALVGAYAPPTKGADFTLLSGTLGADQPARFQIVGASSARVDFGDGAHARGTNLLHLYARAGKYTVTARYGARSVTAFATVARKQPVFAPTLLVSPPPRVPWKPPELQSVPGCH